jgi:hypothetical protein
MNARRNALSLAAVMAATVLTGGAAILGITRAATVATPPAQPAVVQPAAPAAQQEESD